MGKKARKEKITISYQRFDKRFRSLMNGVLTNTFNRTNREAMECESVRPPILTINVHAVGVEYLGGKFYVGGKEPTINVGSLEDFMFLWNEKGIRYFFYRLPSSSIASYGYSPFYKLWFGWSHRAISGFKTRKGAINFAERVS